MNPHHLLVAMEAKAADGALLSEQDLHQRRSELPNWSFSPDRLSRVFEFSDFHQTMAFVNALAWIAHRADHHPDLEVGYNRCTVHWSTHSAGGLTLKDLICAAQVEALQCLKA